MNILMPRRRAILTATSAVATLAMPWPVSANTYPDRARPIRSICPSPPGSATDGVARAYAQAMSETLNTNIIIDNRPGAEGVIGVSAVKSAPADGYTMLFTSLSTQVLNPHLFKQLSYNPRTDFVPLAGTMRTSMILAAGPSVPFKTAREFLASAKANPGKYTFASVSSTTRLAGQMLARAAGVDLLNVPYKNLGDLITNWIGGNVDVMVADGPTFKTYFGKGVRPLAVASAVRVPSLPEVPTLQEEGVTGAEISGWHAAYVATGTPEMAVTKLREAVRQAAHSKYVKDFLANFSIEPFDIAGQELAAYQLVESEKWGKAVRDAGIYGTL